jgi:hypothetical protein
MPLFAVLQLITFKVQAYRKENVTTRIIHSSRRNEMKEEGLSQPTIKYDCKERAPVIVGFRRLSWDYCPRLFSSKRGLPIAEWYSAIYYGACRCTPERCLQAAEAAMDLFCASKVCIFLIYPPRLLWLSELRNAPVLAVSKHDRCLEFM